MWPDRIVLKWKDVGKVDQYLSGSAFRTIPFPVEQIVRRFHTDGYYMYPPLDPTVPGTEYYLTSVNLAFISPMEGTNPAYFGPIPAALYLNLELGEVPALVSETVANQLGIQAGDVYYLRQGGIEIPVIIVEYGPR